MVKKLLVSPLAWKNRPNRSRLLAERAQLRWRHKGRDDVLLVELDKAARIAEFSPLKMPSAAVDLSRSFGCDKGQGARDFGKCR